MNPEIQPAVTHTSDVMSRRPRPTPFLLFHLRLPAFRLRAASLGPDAHRLPPRIRITQLPSPLAVPSVALCHPAFKVRTNY